MISAGLGPEELLCWRGPAAIYPTDFLKYSFYVVVFSLDILTTRCIYTP
jgi:hypothetical protein